MSSRNIIALLVAIIGAAGVIIAALITGIFALLVEQTKMNVTATNVAATFVAQRTIDAPILQATYVLPPAYTPLPTQRPYAPYPTFTPNRIVVTQTPIRVAATQMPQVGTPLEEMPIIEGTWAYKPDTVISLDFAPARQNKPKVQRKSREPCSFLSLGQGCESEDKRREISQGDIFHARENSCARASEIQNIDDESQR